MVFVSIVGFELSICSPLGHCVSSGGSKAGNRLGIPSLGIWGKPRLLIHMYLVS